ncbi:tRNA 2-thiouridine synthesizing protein B [Marinomonas pollencensis]|uniref:tRNA 2-thiouridine synthesizing protein B n=2 Tax=Marinomonas pollencensis TaxID=491954 RepID=A0A3E0DV18_9GAMM|nr:tRNA 2-thiouridine synthesizing protein B [Marinomonas pollencensis]
MYPVDIEQTWHHALQVGDALLLLEEAILRCTTEQQAMLASLVAEKSLCLYYLQSDALAYGVDPAIGTALNDQEWVTLTLSADANISW